MSLCFQADSSPKMANLASEWLTHISSALQLLNTEIKKNMLYFWANLSNNLWFTNLFSSPTLRSLHGFWWDRKQTINILFQFCVFQANSSHEMAPRASDQLTYFQLILEYFDGLWLKLFMRKHLFVHWKCWYYLARYAQKWILNLRLCLGNKPLMLAESYLLKCILNT